MSKFSVGDTVRVTDPESERFDQVLKIAGTWRGIREWVYNFNVDGILFSFAEHHLILAEPTATETINEMLAESEPKKSVGMDEREIDGEYVPGKVDHAATLKTMAQGLAAEMDAAQNAHREAVTHPAHYTSHPSGVECLTITRHMGFALGSAMKYIWRADLKGNAIQDLEKAIFYIQDEIAKRKAAL